MVDSPRNIKAGAAPVDLVVGSAFSVAWHLDDFPVFEHAVTRAGGRRTFCRRERASYAVEEVWRSESSTISTSARGSRSAHGDDASCAVIGAGHRIVVMLEGFHNTRHVSSRCPGVSFTTLVDCVREWRVGAAAQEAVELPTADAGEACSKAWDSPAPQPQRRSQPHSKRRSSGPLVAGENGEAARAMNDLPVGSPSEEERLNYRGRLWDEIDICADRCGAYRTSRRRPGRPVLWAGIQCGSATGRGRGFSTCSAGSAYSADFSASGKGLGGFWRRTALRGLFLYRGDMEAGKWPRRELIARMTNVGLRL